MHIKDIDLMKKKLKESYNQFISKFNFNNYLDLYVSKLKTRLTEKLNPFPVEPTETPFEYGGWFYSIKGVLALTNTKLHNLYSVKRNGIPQVKYNNNNVLLSWQMMFPEIKMTSDYKLHVFDSTKQGDITAKIKNLLADVEFNCDVNEKKAKLSKIKLDSKGGIDVELGGGDITDAIGSVLLKAVSKVFKGEIMKSLEEAVKENVEEVLDGVRLIP